MPPDYATRLYLEHENQMTDEIFLKNCLAYAAEPPHIDRSAWEPCEYCGDPSPHHDCIIGDNIEQFLCSRDGLFQDAYINQREIKFCPYCGRPLTDDAWKMLEKRLEGEK